MVFETIQKPSKDEWGTGLEAMQSALVLEKAVNQELLDLHTLATNHNDPQVLCPSFLLFHNSLIGTCLV